MCVFMEKLLSTVSTLEPIVFFLRFLSFVFFQSSYLGVCVCVLCTYICIYKYVHGLPWCH